MFISLATNVLPEVLCIVLGILWTLYLTWVGIEYMPGRMQLVSFNMPPYYGAPRDVIFKAIRWQVKQCVDALEYRVWLWLNSQVIGA